MFFIIMFSSRILFSPFNYFSFFFFVHFSFFLQISLKLHFFNYFFCIYHRIFFYSKRFYFSIIDPFNFNRFFVGITAILQLTLVTAHCHLRLLTKRWYMHIRWVFVYIEKPSYCDTHILAYLRHVALILHLSIISIHIIPYSRFLNNI